NPNLFCYASPALQEVSTLDLFQKSRVSRRRARTQGLAGAAGSDNVVPSRRPSDRVEGAPGKLQPVVPPRGHRVAVSALASSPCPACTPPENPLGRSAPEGPCVS